MSGTGALACPRWPRRCAQPEADHWLETYERLTDEQIANDRDADCGAEFDPEDFQ